MTAEKQAGLYNEYNDQFRTKLNELEQSGATKEQLEELRAELAKVRDDQFETLKRAMEEQGAELIKLRDREVSKDETSLMAVLKAQKDELIAYADKKRSSVRFQIKADVNKVAGTMAISTNVSGGNVPVEHRLPGMLEIASRRIRLFDVVRTISLTDSNIVSWVDQANKDGAAGQTAEGSAKNQIDFDLVVRNEALKNSTAYIKVTTQALKHIDFMRAAIDGELNRELDKVLESQCFNGDNTGENHNGIATQATAFSAGTHAVSVDNANDVDVLVVANEQIVLANHEDGANAIFVHPSTVTAMKLEKLSSTDKRYVERLERVGENLLMDGIPIIPTTLVSAGTYVIGDFSKCEFYYSGTRDIQVGLDSDDFTKNIRTVLGEQEALTVLKTNNKTAFVTGTFATDKAALETV